MPSHPKVHAARADAVADTICCRRLVNCGLAIVAAWLLYASLFGAMMKIGQEHWWWTLPSTITATATAFAVWSLSFGDRLVWARAYQRAARVDDQSS